MAQTSEGVPPSGPSVPLSLHSTLCLCVSKYPELIMVFACVYHGEFFRQEVGPIHHSVWYDFFPAGLTISSWFKDCSINVLSKEFFLSCSHGDFPLLCELRYLVAKLFFFGIEPQDNKRLLATNGVDTKSGLAEVSENALSRLLCHLFRDLYVPLTFLS